MSRLPVIAIFDVGKTNKKLLLYDQQYQIVLEESVVLLEIRDEDGFPCEDVVALTKWVKSSYFKILSNPLYDLKAVNFSGYGASFVYISKDNEVFLPLYNYLKPLDVSVRNQFYNTYEGEKAFSTRTASPVLDNLNSGMQLFRLKQERPSDFENIRYALHLPQYLSTILSDVAVSEMTSIGCHTNLWDFQQGKYHEWVLREELLSRLAPIVKGTVVNTSKERVKIGVGLHDSSAALIPYLHYCKEPFVLISTGTWCISLNPFDVSPLTQEELKQDCLCYLTSTGRQVKAARLFAGYEHEQQVKRITECFNTAADYYQGIQYDPNLSKISGDDSQSNFAGRDLRNFVSYEHAYHQLILDIVVQQVRSLKLVLNDDVQQIFVDGGFSKNQIYMNLLAKAMPGHMIFAATVSQASALGAAMIIHAEWNNQPLPAAGVALQLYSVK